MTLRGGLLAGGNHLRPLRRRSADGARSVPGEVGIWVFVLGDMTAFALFFCIFAYYRGQNPTLFEESRLALDRNVGAVNTLLLLTSSLFVVLGVRAARSGMRRATMRLLALARLCGLAFAVLKLFEYRAKLSHDITPSTNDFYMYYYIFTGIHLLHVVIGIVVLSALIMVARYSAAVEQRVTVLENGGIYWHMVDLLWLVLFSLFYLA